MSVSPGSTPVLTEQHFTDLITSSITKVLILEPTKVYQPSYVSINSEADEKNVSIWHVSPAETVSGLFEAMFAV